jgi:hypothetical protein
MNVDRHRAAGKLRLGAFGMVLLLAAGAAAGCGSSTSSAPAASGGKLTTMSLVLTFPEGWESPIWYGLEKGIFKQNGLNLQISAPSGAEAGSDITFVSKGQFDAGYVGTYDIPVYQQKYGDNVVNVFGWAQQNRESDRRAAELGHKPDLLLLRALRGTQERGEPGKRRPQLYGLAIPLQQGIGDRQL